VLPHPTAYHPQLQAEGLQRPGQRALAEKIANYLNDSLGKITLANFSRRRNLRPHR